MDVSVREILARTRGAAQSSHSKMADQSHINLEAPPLPTFMQQPVDSEPLKGSHSRKTLRSAVRVGGLTLGVAAALVVVFSKTASETVLDTITDLDSVLGQAFAADFSTNNPGESTLPIAIYPDQRHGAPQDNPAEPTMTAEELKQKMQALREEMDAIEQQNYGPGDAFSETFAMEGDGAPDMVAETVSENVVTPPANIANPRWEEPLTPPRWGDGYNSNREGVVVPLDRPQQTAWLPTPQWQRTKTYTPRNNGPYNTIAYTHDTTPSPNLNPQPSGHFRIQLGSFRSSGSAESGWRQLLSQNRDIFGVLDHSVEQADLGSRGIYYRLQAGSFANADVAKILCDEVKARDADCLVVRR